MTASTGNTGIFSVGSPIGINTQRRTNAVSEINPQEFALGTEALVSNGFIAVYVQNFGITTTAGISANSQVTINWPTAHAASVATGTYTNFSAAFASGDFGWVFKAARIA